MLFILLDNHEKFHLYKGRMFKCATRVIPDLTQLLRQSSVCDCEYTQIGDANEM